ncbi:8830_t:CDS:2 [Acaulospora morrowiae]|uniref:8830_t:CDS:1 n=1 Tax=Acaulospora morrowiae TaxID=94023 RepID=A0A9N9H5Y9_9GLOM|nr:8830_t:CDS:2 [Acaulospora morrowiae]
MVKSRETQNTPMWVIILYGISAFIVVIIIVRIRFIKDGQEAIIYFMIVLGVHVVSDLCFLFYSRAIDTNESNIFVYLHAVSGIITGSGLLIEEMYEGLAVSFLMLYIPFIQMLNMALLSDNNYYLKKLIFASNLIYISRILNYLKDALSYYYNMMDRDYKSLIGIFIRGICSDYTWGGLIGDSQFRRIYLLIKYGGEKTKLLVKINRRVGKILKVDDGLEPEKEFDDRPRKEIYEAEY